MEYISGVTVAKYMTDIRLVDIYKFVELFLNICRENTYDVGAREIFTKKIQNLKLLKKNHYYIVNVLNYWKLTNGDIWFLVSVMVI